MRIVKLILAVLLWVMFVFMIYKLATTEQYYNAAKVDGKIMSSEYVCKLGVLYLYYIEYEQATDVNGNPIACETVRLKR